MRHTGGYLLAILLVGLTMVILSTSDKTPRLRLEEVAGGFEAPVGLAHANDGSGRLFVIEKGGTIRIVQEVTALPTPFLDISNRVSVKAERGLLGLVFDPQYASNGAFYVCYTNRVDQTIVAQYQVSAEDPNLANPRSEVLVLRIKQPTGNHHGGHLAFGPDGYLYISTGDGGSREHSKNSQDLSNLLGKLLRVDAANRASPDGLAYTIPNDNPFRDTPGARAEIWAYGLRNPWRFSFDRANGDLYIADPGQNRYEEVNFQAAARVDGRNYGWDVMEGRHCYQPVQGCSQEVFVLPVVEYPHIEGNIAVVGGYVYRGQGVPSLWGMYLFGDYGSGRIWATSQMSGWGRVELLDTQLVISSFGEDEAGEVFVLDYRGGSFFRLTED